MKELGFPVIATSGNKHDEPICISESEALDRLGSLADLFLVHNRIVIRPVDDSVTRVVCGHPQILRRARGYAPLPLYVKNTLPPVISFGGHLKNTIAIGQGNEMILSQHIGDLETGPAFDSFKSTIADMERLYGFVPEQVACDLHPAYISTQYATQLNNDPIHVQHHYAHVLSCIADNAIGQDVLGVCWDGTGFGTDGTIWGSEFLKITPSGFERFAHFRYFSLPGGNQSIKQPKRTALGLLYELYGKEVSKLNKQWLNSVFKLDEARLIMQILEKKINIVSGCSAGRLFDAVASLAGICQETSFEGQAAISLENIIDEVVTENSYPYELCGGEPVVVNWQPMIEAIENDIENKVPIGVVSAMFHNTLTEIILEVCERAGQENIMLTGGCFMNRYLTERTVARLSGSGFKPFIHHRVPPNDGGIAVGQVMAVTRLSQYRPKTSKNTKEDQLEINQLITVKL